MKQNIILLILSISTIFSGNYSSAHGFGPGTLVKHPSQGWSVIQQIFQIRESKAEDILCFDTTRELLLTRGVKAAGQSETNCYFRIGFDEWFNDDILCTPSQEFYMPETRTWQPACMLKIGDALLSSSNEPKFITHLEFVKKPLDVYSIEVESIHNFFVGRHSILTHNMVIPLFTSLSVGFSFGSGATVGGKAGGFFGPVGVVGGVIVGGIVGVAVASFSNNKTMHYKLTFNSQKIDELIHLNDSKGGAQAPGMPTDKDGFFPPKKWDGKKIKNQNGKGGIGWPDKDGNVWIPTGPNGHGGPHWDVQHPKGGYKNILPGGKIRGQK